MVGDYLNTTNNYNHPAFSPLSEIAVWLSGIIVFPKISELYSPGDTALNLREWRECWVIVVVIVVVVCFI